MPLYLLLLIIEDGSSDMAFQECIKAPSEAVSTALPDGEEILM